MTLNYLNIYKEGDLLNEGRKIKLAIKDSERINWNHQLEAVHSTEQNLTEEENLIANYWGAGARTKQITPIMDVLIDTYDVSAPHASRMLAAVHSAINDAFIVCWNLKYKWDVARPNQLDQNMHTIICTPNPYFSIGSLGDCRMC